MTLFLIYAFMTPLCIPLLVSRFFYNVFLPFFTFLFFIIHSLLAPIPIIGKYFDFLPQHINLREHYNDFHYNDFTVMFAFIVSVISSISFWTFLLILLYPKPS